MADVIVDINQTRAIRIAQRRIRGFAQQFGDAHCKLARHAAFPLVLTPDLLYQIWANFVPEAPWTAVAHVLLSRLCRQVGYEMYEMDTADRNLLLRELKEQFGQERFDELGEFLLDYVAQRLTDDDADTQDLREAQEWVVLAYTKPDEAARELAQALSQRVQQEDMGEVLRLASLVETLAEPLVKAGFEPLLAYSRGIGSFARDDLEQAKAELSQMIEAQNQIEVAGESLHIPESIKHSPSQLPHDDVQPASLSIDLKFVTQDYVELRYFIDNPNDYHSLSLTVAEIADLIKLAERDYYIADLPEDYTVTGRRLYNWLDGSERWLQPLLDKHRRKGIVLAIAAAEKLAHLPWEVLHDGDSFLVQRVPAIVPVRWVSDSTVKKLTVEGEPENRALQVLFMATSPPDVKPVLDFEAEEARILEATKRQPLELTVEESGCLSELGYLVDGYDRDYFDVLHLMGHFTLQNGQPRFITETTTGEAYYASAGDIAQELKFRLPKLIFLSGGSTGQAGNSDSVSSMAEELVKSGAKAVLGWSQQVLNPEASAAPAALYQELSGGKQIREAVASTYQALIKKKARDWHLLRLYAAGNLPSSLVTPLRTRGRKPAPPLSVSTQFLDPAGKVKVPTRESFVGRRRQLQNCLRVLVQSSDEVGVLIHGMGGLGKSSLAARLCDRLPNFERVVWVGHIDEGSLVSRLAEKLDDNEQRKSLQNYDEELRYRLRKVFQQLHEQAKPFLLVLDDFEENLEPRNQSYALQLEAAEVLTALVWAIRENYTFHRIIITCRYDFEFTQLQHFYKQPLDALQGKDLQQKYNLLPTFGAKSQVDEALKWQAQKLADGNPRLLEWLDKILQNTTVDQAAILNRLAADPVELREQVLAEALLRQMDTTMREMLSRGIVFELPVPRQAFAAVCKDIPNLDQLIDRAVALGLLQVSPDSLLRVSHILPMKLPEDAEALYKQAAEVLYHLWFKEAKTYMDEKRQEIHRLAVEGKAEKIVAEITKT